MKFFTRLTFNFEKAIKTMMFVAFLLIGVSSFSQNSYLGLDGGLEGTATVDATFSAAAPSGTNGKWTTAGSSSTQSAIALETTNVRSGAKSLKISGTNTSLARVWTPSFAITATTTKFFVQYYRRSASTTNTQTAQLGVLRGGTEQLNGTYATVSAANTWEKVTYAPSAVTSASSVAGVIGNKANNATGGDYFVDDFVIYSDAAVDNTAPSVPGSFTFSGQTNTSIGVSWAAASGGVDGGGYIVVRGTADPTTAPNVNGIYATSNTIGSGTVVYQGTGTSFTDTGLTAGTTYFYRVYTYDKAYNYSAATTGNSATTAGLAIDGTISTNEYGTHTNGNNQQSSATGTWYMNWDSTNLYIGITGTNTAEGAVLYLDKNPITPVNGGTNSDGNLTGYNNYDGTNFANLQFRADLVVYFKDGYREYRTADGAGGWSAATSGFGSYASASGTKEVAIPWSAIGGMPSAFNWFGYVAYTGGGAYASVPTQNPGSGAGTIIGSSARWDRYYTVSTTTIGSATPPFSRNSYTFTSSTDVTSFGSISAYDFTMNSAGRFVSRTGNVTGNWTIGGNLTIGAGTIYMGSGGSGYGTTSVTGNLNLLGGTYDMDATTAATSITGNVSIASGATLKLSSQVGGDLNVTGNWSNSGTFTPNSRAVTFNSASVQTLTGSTSFDYLTLAGNGGVTLQTSSPVTVNNTLTLGSGSTTGKLILGANTLTMGASATISGASSTAFIVTDTATSLLKRNSVGGTATSFPVGNLSTSYTPLTITNTGTTNDLSVGSSATIDNAVTDATKIVTLQWSVVSGGAGAVGTIAYNWNVANQAVSYSATGTGELGVYTTGPYAITSLGTMSGQTKTATGIALASGTNKMVIGNTAAVYNPPPTNDECAGAISLTVNAAATAGNNSAATKSNPSTITGTAYTTGTAKDMWYTFTPSCSGSHTITMTPTGFDGAVGLFTGGACPNPTFTSLADAGASGTAETITFTATAGVTYRILVWGYNSASGNFTIGVTTSVTPNFTLANTGTPATGNIASGTNNAVLYGFALTPTACTNSFDFTAASIATSGTATSSDLSNFRIIVDANANGVADSGEIASPIGTVSTLANPLSFTVTGQTGLTAVTRYLLIADVNSAATGGNTFTASMAAANVTASVTVSGTAAGNAQTITAASIAIADNTQVTTGNIFRGSTNNIISKAQLTVGGQSTTVTAMNFVTAGVTGGYTSADIATGGFKLWVSTTNSFGSATQVGTGVSSAKATATNTETLSFTTSQSLTVGTTYYYWLTVDVAATATVARTITVNGLSNASVTSAGTTITGTTTAAGAQTIIAPTLVIANNTTVPAGNVLIGSTNNIVARAQFTVTNATVALSAMSYVTASNASGYTSADIATGGFKLWVNTTNTFAGATQVGTGQTSTKSTGASTETITFTATQTLTTGVYYYWLTADIASTATPAKVIIVNGLSSGSLTSTTTGVAISGTSSTSGTQTIVTPTLTISNNTQITTQNLFAGSTNNIISKAQVVPTNDNVAASAISFVTAGNATGYTSADIATGGFKLWVNTTNTFAGATQVGSGQSSTKTTATNTETITFTATQNFTLGTTYYYWLTADLDSAATVGNIIIVNGLSSTSITTTTTGAVVTGTTSATGNQTIAVPTVTLANTGTPATGSIAIGSSNVVLFGFGLTPNTSVDFTAASITTSGSATSSDLSNFRLVYDANANGLADTSEITGAIGTVSTLSGTLAFTGLTGQTAFSTVRRYLLIADASSGATSGRTFTGSLTAANITTTATTNTGSAAGNAQTLVYIAAAGEIVINQLNPGYTTASDEYIELVNKTGKTFDMSNLKIVYYSAAGSSNASLIGTLSGTLQPYSFYLISPNSSITVGATSGLAADFVYASAGLAGTSGQVSLQRVSDNLQIDGVAYGTITTNAVNEGSAAPAGTTVPSVGNKRTIDGNDTNSNSADFSTVTNANIYLRNSTGRLAGAGATIAAGSYRDLSVTGSSSIAGNVSLSSQLRLDNSGILATGSNTLTLASTASVSRISGWVNGSLKKNVATGATSRTFEIGGATFYRPVTVAFGSVTTAGDLTATLSASAGDYPQIADSGIDSSKSVNRYWTLTNSGIAFTNYSATFTFDATDVDSGANTANFIVRNYNGSWNTSTAGTRTSTSTQATGITTFGDFVIGETTGSPTVASNPSGYTGCPGGATSFSSTSSSVPTPTIAWERGISGTYTTITSVLDGGVYSNFNTSTLSISNTSGLGGYTYRAVYTNINGTVTSTAATLNVGVTKTYSSGWSPSAPTSIDTAVISSNYSVAADINACSLTVNSGAVVVIPSGNNVNLSGTLTVDSGSTFTLNNNANLLQGGTTNNNSGNIVVKRNSAALKRLDYTLWSSPVSGQGLYAFSPFTFANRFYIYNSSTDLYAAAGLNVTGTNADGVNGTDSNNVQFNAATGYLIRVPWDHPTAPTVWTGTFTGVPNNGTITRSGLTSGLFYAVGNPYPSTISADQFIADNSIGNNPLTPGDGLYFWRKTNNAAASSYATYTTAGGVKSGGDTLNIVPNGVIQVGEGFIVKTTSSSLAFNNGQRIVNNADQFLRTATTIERNRIWLNLSDSTNAIVNQMMVAYMTGATQGIDAAIDGRYFNDSQTALNSFVNNEEFAIQGRSLPFDSADVVPLAFKSAAAGNFTISLDNTDGLFAGGAQPIYLKDNQTNTEHDLSTGGYTFATNAGTFNDRFQIIYQSQLGTGHTVFTPNSVVIYNQNNDLVINTGSITMASIKVFDIRGRLIQERKDINTSQAVINAGLANGVLLVQITSQDGVVVTKKVIK